MIASFHSEESGVTAAALVAVGRQLTEWGHRVLIIDFAGGLPAFLGVERWPETKGLGALLGDFAAGVVTDTAHYVIETELGHLIPFGAEETDWAALYAAGLAALLDACRVAWSQDYDFVLVNVPADRGDAAGISLAQIPDVLVALTEGDTDVADMAGRIVGVRDRLPFDQARLHVVPVAIGDGSRLDPERFEAPFGALFDSWITRGAPRREVIRRMALPLRHAMVNQDEAPRPPLLAVARQPAQFVAALLAHRLAGADQLLLDPEEYLRSAPKPPEHGPAAVDPDLRDDVVDLLRDLPGWQLLPDEWTRLGAELAGLTELVGGEDMPALAGAVRALELAGPVLSRPEDARYPIPQDVAVMVTSLLRRLSR